MQDGLVQPEVTGFQWPPCCPTYGPPAGGAVETGNYNKNEFTLLERRTSNAHI